MTPDVPNPYGPASYSEAAMQSMRDKVAELERRLDVARIERDMARARFDRTVQILIGINRLLDPPIIEASGVRYKFNNPMAAEVLHELSNRIRAVPDAIDAAIAKESNHG